MSVGSKLKEILKDKNMTISELADISGVSRNTLYAITKRDSFNVRFETLNKIANALKISPGVLLGIPITSEEFRAADDHNFADVLDELSVERSFDNEPSDDKDELTEYLDELHKRPEMKMLFKVAKKATKEDVEKAVKIIEMFKGKPSDDDDI